MGESINLIVDFVAGSQDSVTQASAASAQTGDVIMFTVFAIVALLMLVGAVLFVKKGGSSHLLHKTNGNHNSQNNLLALTNNKVAFGVIALLTTIVLVCGVFAISKAFASNDSQLVPNTNKITATVADDGTISFPECVLTNTSENAYTISSSSVVAMPEAENVSAIEDCNVTIDGFGGVLYDGTPDGLPYTTTSLTPLQSGNSASLIFNINNLDKESALSLCGKSVLGITLIPTKLFTVDATVDDPTNGTISGSPIYNVAEGTEYTANKTTNKITIGQDASAQTITFTPSPGFELDKWMIDGAEVTTGTITSDTIFVAVTKAAIKSLDIDGVHYYPVVTKFTEVKFYDSDGIEIPPASSTGYEMSDLVEAHYYSGNASFTGVRSINGLAYDTVYGKGGTGPKKVDEDWAAANLKPNEIVEKLTQESSPSGMPKINTIGLTTIWKALNSEESGDGFGGSYGLFGSCVAHTTNLATAWFWDSASDQSGCWSDGSRDIDFGVYVCVSRAFN